MKLCYILRATGGVLTTLAFRHCWKHLQHPDTAWSIWRHCPLFHGAKLHHVDGSFIVTFYDRGCVSGKLPIIKFRFPS